MAANSSGVFLNHRPSGERLAGHFIRAAELLNSKVTDCGNDQIYIILMLTL